jgi:hypothetical protein
MSGRRSEAGVTLLELMIAVGLLGLIIVPLTGAMVTGLINTGEANTRLSESRSSLFTSAYYADDVQSSEQGLLVATPNTPSWLCGSGTNVLSVGWTETTTPQTPTPTPPPIRVSYVLSTDSKGNPVLKRNYCDSNGTSSATVAPVLDASVPATVTCFSATNASVACDTTGSSAPRTVRLIAKTPNKVGVNYFTLIASRRPT